MTGAAIGEGNAYPSRALDFTSGFHRGFRCPVICVSLFHVIVLSFYFLTYILYTIQLYPNLYTYIIENKKYSYQAIKQKEQSKFKKQDYNMK